MHEVFPMLCHLVGKNRFFKNSWEIANKGYVFIDLISTSLYVYSVLDPGLITRKTAEQDWWTGEQDNLQTV